MNSPKLKGSLLKGLDKNEMNGIKRMQLRCFVGKKSGKYNER